MVTKNGLRDNRTLNLQEPIRAFNIAGIYIRLQHFTSAYTRRFCSFHELLSALHNTSNQLLTNK